MSLHRVRAKKKVMLAQISAIGLVALAGYLAVMPAPGATVAANPVPPPHPGAPQPPVAPTTTTFDVAAVSNVFSRARRGEPIVKPQAEEHVVADEATPEDIALPEDPSGPPQVRLVGVAQSSRRTYAFITDAAGHTKSYVAGDYIGEYMLLGISSEKMILADCHDTDIRHEYILETRPEIAPATAVVEMTAPKRPMQPAMANPNTARYYEQPNASVALPEGVDLNEWEKQEAKRREMESRARQATSGSTPPNAVTRPQTPTTAKSPNTPPNRAPATQPKPATPTPTNKTTPAKEQLK